jgi:cell division protein FtsW (lipid II flippase)
MSTIATTGAAPAAPAVRAVPAAERPSAHLVLLFAVLGLGVAGYVAVIFAASLRGYTPSFMFALRDLAIFAPIFFVVFWLARRQKYKGTMTLFTAALLLFTVGMVIQYRLFRDPEYNVSNLSKRREAREAKAQFVRYGNVRTVYDDEKKTVMFGSPVMPEEPPGRDLPVAERTFGDLLTSVNTYIPIAALFAFCLAFRFFKSDNFLDWLQRHALILAVATLLPFAVIVLAFSSEGKFLGQTTPWEPVKIIFLVSFAAMLADAYRHLGRTRWGIPPLRFALPFAVVAALPVVPFFALSDFGQMLVFFGVYAALYAIAVRKKVQIAYALALTLAIGALLYGVVGLPGRVNLRFHLWLYTWQAPPEDAAWWAPRLARIRQQYGFPVTNEDAWYDQSAQLAQGLFGISDGGLIGTGLGLGYPEIVPVSDSDFIYAAAAEELGLLGGGMLLLATAAIVIAGSSIAIGARDMFTKLVAAGLTGFIGFQALVNVGGVIRLLPMTGITLPFVSHGGWSLITSFAMLGILMAIAHRNATPQAPAPG